MAQLDDGIDHDGDDVEEADVFEDKSSKSEKLEILSFRCVGRMLAEDDIEAEFMLMRDALSRVPIAADLYRVGMGSGSHLLKLTTPRAALDQCVLRFTPADTNSLPVFAPSVNAPDIPFAKIVFRPLEVLGRTPKSLIDHIRDPEDLSPRVLKAFAMAFGDDCLHALRSAILGKGQEIISLPDTGEFPTIFLPRPGGGDIQATPISPVEAFMGFKNMSSAWFLKQEKDAPPVPRGRWTRQAISAKPQNISGAIGGPRQRFLATMPAVMRDYEAAIMRYARGGAFPFWWDDDVEAAVLHYAGRLEMPYTNSDIRAGTDWYADKLIAGALDFIEQVRADALELLEQDSASGSDLRTPSTPSALLMRRRWKKDDQSKAIKALTSPHFQDRERIALEKLED